ncbi:RNA-guided endonuclease InsQ/TnpB family protein [Ectobacillus antri]|uniref:RNA-guided endonuclease InsQ/TnpB family protein n=1 Tax=Ectobacillus antri TaxID=2486280 RepID=UPI000F5980C0|nr:RNA-guided endonuclease TnpB family protein [Ectobacillus antri]
MITVRKLKLAIVSGNENETYQFLRNEMRNQYKALNISYSHLYFEYIAQEKIKHSNEEYQQHLTKYTEKAQEKYQNYLKCKGKAEVFKDDQQLQKRVEKARDDYNKAQEKVYKIEKQYSKKASEIYQKAVGLVKQTRIGKLINSKFDLHYDTVDRITSTVISHFTCDMKAGLLNGKRNLRNYKETNPLMIRARSMVLYEESGDYFIKWIKGITFKVILLESSKQRANINELKSLLVNIIEGNYKICDSSIAINKKLILNLSLNIPVSRKNSFMKGRVVGLDLGLRIPAYVSINDKPYIRKSIGSIEDFLKVRTQIQSQRKRLQKALQSTRGGKGKNKKLQGLNRIKEKEKNFVNTYNHFISSKIVQFALKNQAGIIHMEYLEFDRMKNKSLLRNWSYYQLQQMIEYKAKREGIEVKYIDAHYTSQTCSKCNHYELGQREIQEKFSCKSCGFNANADYNASQNIANSIKFITTNKKIIEELEVEEKQLSLDFNGS